MDNTHSDHRPQSAKKVVAWEITEQYEWYTCIIFHRHGIAARRIGACELNADFKDVQCRRLPRYDQYAAVGSVPTKVLADDGQWLECCSCSHVIYCDRVGDTDEPFVLIDDDIYCSDRCAQHHVSDQPAREPS